MLQKKTINVKFNSNFKLNVVFAGDSTGATANATLTLTIGQLQKLE